MSFTIAQLDSHLIGMGHMGTLNKVRNKYQMYERSASKFLLKAKPVTIIRSAALASVVHDDMHNYALPSDFGTLIDLIPQDNRESWDSAYRAYASQFDLEKATKNRVVSIEGSEGTKIIRINWKSRQAVLLNALNTTTENGTWAVTSAAASGVATDSIFKVSGSGSVKFNLVSTGGGIKNTTMTAVDLTDEDEVADCFVWVYLPSTSITSIAVRWGNDLTTNYWTPTAQTTQADGTAFKVGWNLIKFAWAGATETGTVAPATVDSFQLTINGSTAINNIRVDNIMFSIGRAFDIKYYSKFLFENSSGTWISLPTTDDDTVNVDNDSMPVFLLELLKDMAHQVEGSDSAFDITYARQEMEELFPHFRAENPNQSKKTITSYTGRPRLRR